MKKIIIILQVALVVGGCAKVGSPTGGPKDEDPPVMVLSDPENYSTKFKAKKVEIEFNEYVELKNVQTNLIISPPFNEDPYVRVKGKGIVLDIEDSLENNTTYTLNFGNSIVDFREGNPATNFEYVFSTGEHLDSLSVSGNIVDAFNLKADKDPFFVMLYENLSDSAPLIEKPLYLGKTDDKGNFRINNIRTDTFRLFALQDANSNLKYDLPEEKIAFIDSVFYLNADELIRFDTILYGYRDSTNIDSLVLDSIAQDSMVIMPVYTYDCNLFSFIQDESENSQYLKDYSRNKKYKLNLVFNTEIKDSVYLTPLNFSTDNQWCIIEKNVGNDTLNYWITDSTIYNMDTLVFSINYQGLDSLNNYVWMADTNSFRLTKKQASKSDKKVGKKDVVEEDDEKYLSVRANFKNKSTIDLNKHVNFYFENPLSFVDTSKINFYLREDTILKKQTYQFFQDSIKYRKFHFINSWIEDSRYKLVMEPGAFTDLYGISNDTLEYDYVTQKMDFYGIILLNLTGVDTNMVVQLMDMKEKPISEKTTNSDGEIIFDYLKPTEYMIKVIYDENKNGKWDTGNYLKHVQPEKVEYYKGEIQIRSNWDMQVNFSLKN